MFWACTCTHTYTLNHLCMHTYMYIHIAVIDTVSYKYTYIAVTHIIIDVPSQESRLLRRLNSQFPGDIGCFCVFFLNYLHLNPGEAIYLAPNEPHAYIYGGTVHFLSVCDFSTMYCTGIIRGCTTNHFN